MANDRKVIVFPHNRKSRGKVCRHSSSIGPRQLSASMLLVCGKAMEQLLEELRRWLDLWSIQAVLPHGVALHRQYVNDLLERRISLRWTDGARRYTIDLLRPHAHPGGDGRWDERLVEVYDANGMRLNGRTLYYDPSEAEEIRKWRMVLATYTDRPQHLFCNSDAVDVVLRFLGTLRSHEAEGRQLIQESEGGAVMAVDIRRSVAR